MTLGPHRIIKSTRVATLTAAWLVTTSSSCLAFETLQKIDFELTGTVRDADTKEPLEGAYVIASYKILRSGLAATDTFCVKTKGMYTGKDGRYHFPVEKLDGRSPESSNAIKPGYFLKNRDLPEPKRWRKQDAEAYSDRDIYLKKQDPSKPEWRFSNGDDICHEAPTREAASAGIEFLRLRLAELIKYGAPPQGPDATKHLIEMLERRPAESATVK